MDHKVENHPIGWQQLPDKVLLNIFLVLEESDFVHASCVCRRWRQLFHEPRFWRSATFDLNQSFQSPEEVKQKLANHLQAIGFYVRHVTIICPDSDILVPRQMTDWVKVILDTLVKNNRTILSFKLKNLRMEQYWRGKDYAKCELVDSICHFIESQTCLQTLVLSEALLPITFGHMVMSNLARSPSVDTLQQLDIFYFYAFARLLYKRHRDLVRSALFKCKLLQEITLNYCLLKEIEVDKLCEQLQHSLQKIHLRTLSALNDGRYEDYYEDHDREYEEHSIGDVLKEDGLGYSYMSIAPHRWTQATRTCPGLRVSMEIDIVNDVRRNRVDIQVLAMPVSHLTVKVRRPTYTNVDSTEITFNGVLKRLCRSQLENLETISFIGPSRYIILYDPEVHTNRNDLMNFLEKYPNLRSVQFSADLMSFSVLECVQSEMRARCGLDRDVLSITKVIP